MVKEINLKSRGKYGSSADKALEKWEREYLERNLVDELDLLIYHLQTYACLRLGESIQCTREWLETPFDEEHKDKLIINICKGENQQIDTFEKFKNSQSKKLWKPKTCLNRCIVVYNPYSIQIIRMFFNKYKYGVSEFYPNVSTQRSVERSIQRKTDCWVDILQEEHRRRLNDSGMNLSEEEIDERILRKRSKLSPHALRSTGENYLLYEKGINPTIVQQMTGHSEQIQKKHYVNSKDLLQRAVPK